MSALQEYVVKRLNSIPGLKTFEPQGAFYIFTIVTAFYGPNVSAKDFGPVPDSDTLCR